MKNLAAKTPINWASAEISECLLHMPDGRQIHQGWSPQCENDPRQDESEWACIKTTAIQPGVFLPVYNKKLPNHLAPRPGLEIAHKDLLLTCAGPRNRCGITCLVKNPPHRLMISGKMYRFRVPESEILPEFLEAYLRSPKALLEIDNIKTGANDSGLNLTQDRFRKLQIPIAPIREQRRIVAKLDALFEKSRSIREKLDRLPRLLANLQKSILNSAFRGDLTREWRANNPNVEPASQLLKRIRAERRAKWEADLITKGKDPKKAKYVEPEPVEAEGLPELPEGWCWASVESISTKVVDGVHKKPNYVSEGVPFLTVKDLTAGAGISFENCRYVSQADHQEFIKRTNPERGDILITKDGTLGVIRAIRTDVEFSIFVSLALVKPVLLEMSDYLELAFLSPILQAQMTGTGSGLQHIHLTDLRKDLLPLPPLEEQREIVRVLSALISGVETLAGQIRNANARMPSIDSSLLSKAFRGELVPQDPNDEPASVLLERIRAQKPAAETKRGRGRKSAA